MSEVISKEEELNRLQGEFSDYHKDYYGYRPRFGTSEEWNNPNWLKEQMERISSAFKKQEETFEGRQQLREEGWCLADETDPALLKLQKEAEEQRKQRRQALY